MHRRRGRAPVGISRSRASFTAPDYVSELQRTDLYAHVAQLVEHILGKDEVTGSIPVVSPIELLRYRRPGRGDIPSFGMCRLQLADAGVTQLVESQPSKLLVAGSSPVSRSSVCTPALFGPIPVTPAISSGSGLSCKVTEELLFPKQGHARYHNAGMHRVQAS